jgi:hypothetical protein
MPVAIDDVKQAFVKAVEDYGCKGEGAIYQTDLKPLTVLAAVGLLPLIDRPAAAPKPVLYVNAMRHNADRRWVLTKVKRAVKIGDFECLVDLNLQEPGPQNGNPFKVLLTAESEGYAGHAKGLAQAKVGDNDLLWDLYKLLIVPSPLRLFVCLSADKYSAIVKRRLEKLAKEYAGQVLRSGDGPAYLWVLVLPTGSLASHQASLFGLKFQGGRSESCGRLSFALG